MFDIVKKLMMARQITMEKGEIRLLGQRMIMAPAITFYYLQNIFSSNELSNKMMYYTCKVTNTRGYASGLSEHYGLKGEKLIQWMANSSQLAGWGEFELVNFDAKQKRAIVQVKNSAVATYFKKQAIPVDHMIRGYCAGVAAMVFNDNNIDMIETKCLAKGDKICEFVGKPTKEFDFNSKLITSQLDESGEIEKKLRNIAWNKKQ